MSFCCFSLKVLCIPGLARPLDDNALMMNVGIAENDVDADSCLVSGNSTWLLAGGTLPDPVLPLDWIHTLSRLMASVYR